jgi:hypothetical protein
MTAERDVTRFVREWLEDGANVMPDRVLDSALDQLPATPQRRHWWQAWRNPFVMNNMKLALAAGVVVLATFVGLGLYFNQPGLIGPSPIPTINPTPTLTEAPTPTSEPTPAPPDASISTFIPNGGTVPAGTYVTSSFFPLQVEFTVPTGWQSWSVERDGIGVMKNDPPAGFGLWIVREVYPDPCNRVTNGPIDPGPTVDDLAGALQGLEGYQATMPTDVSLGGYSGKYLEITAPTDLSLSACEAGDPRLWRTEARGNRSVYAGGEHDRIWILDVEGTRLLVKAAHQVGTPEADVAELEQMVNSIRIRPPEAPTPTAEAPSSSPMSFSRLGGIAGMDVPAGTYVTDLSFPLQIQFTVPASWQRWTADSKAVGVYRHGGEPPLGSRFGFWIVDEIAQDPCDPGRGAVDPGPAADDLANGLAGLPWSTGSPADVSLGGLGARYVELTAPNDLAQCLDFRGLETATFLGHSIGPGSRWLIWILDVNDTRLVVVASYRPPTPESDVAELQQMVDSIVIRP